MVYELCVDPQSFNTVGTENTEKTWRAPRSGSGKREAVLLHQPEFLNALARADLGDVHVSLRVYRQKMNVGKFAGISPHASETGEKLAARSIEDIDLLVVLIRDIHILLSGIARKSDRNRRSQCARLVLGSRRKR